MPSEWGLGCFDTAAWKSYQLDGYEGPMHCLRVSWF